MKTGLHQAFKTFLIRLRLKARRNPDVIKAQGTAYDSESRFYPKKQEFNDKIIGDSDRRTIELNSKGIFACPKYTDLFQDGDDVKIE